MSEPRIPPLPIEDWDDETRQALGGRYLNIFGTLAYHPKLLKRWLVFGNHVLGKSTLSGRDREILILRAGWNCRAPYEWGQHVAIGRVEGLTDDEIVRIAEAPDSPEWKPLDALLIKAADELHADSCISDATFAALSEHYDTQQLIDVVFTVGQYTLVSMALNSFGVERDDGVTGVPLPAR